MNATNNFVQVATTTTSLYSKAEQQKIKIQQLLQCREYPPILVAQVQVHTTYICMYIHMYSEII